MKSIDKLTVGSLFSGIGGFELGFSWTGGFETKWMCEYDPHAQRILKQNFPGIPIYSDVRDICKTIHPEKVDCLVGGFPCQDVSEAGLRRGMSKGTETRSSLYHEFARIIGEIKPRWVVIENVRGLLSIDLGRGIGRVFRDLADMGYDAEGKVIRACSFGAPHQRQRVFIVAYPNGLLGTSTFFHAMSQESELGGIIDSDTPIIWNGVRFDGTAKLAIQNYKATLGTPVLFGVDDGIPDWLDRNTRLGNAVVPQVAQYIGELILEHERRIEGF